MRPHALRALALALTALGCVHYQAKPIVPDQALAAFAARSLDEPALAGFIDATGTVPPAEAQQPWDVRSLTLAAFYFSPELEVARAEVAAAEAGETTAGARENPSVIVSAGYNSTTPAGSISPWIPSINFDIPIATAGKRGHRIAAAKSLADAARFNLAGAAWRVHSRVRAGLVELYAASEAARVLGEQVAAQTEYAAVIEREFEAGELSSADVTQANTALVAARAAGADAEARKIEAETRLADSVGVPVDAVRGAQLSYACLADAAAAPPAANARLQAVLNRADVLGALAEYAASQAALRFEIARQYPDIHIGPGYELDQTDNKWFLALTLPLPIMNRNQGPIAEAEAARSASAARFTAVQAHALAEVDQAATALAAAQAAAEAAARVEAGFARRERVARARYDAGDISRLELTGARLERVTAELAAADATARAAAAVGALEDAMQSPLGVPAWAWLYRSRPHQAGSGEEMP